jgi:hypothetical protein
VIRVRVPWNIPYLTEISCAGYPLPIILISSVMNDLEPVIWKWYAYYLKKPGVIVV